MASMSRQNPSRSDGVTPTHAVAVMVGNAANIVWINRDRYICVYTAPAGTEKDRAESNEKYILTAPRIDNRPVQVRARDPRLATIDYTDENDGAEMVSVTCCRSVYRRSKIDLMIAVANLLLQRALIPLRDKIRW